MMTTAAVPRRRMRSSSSTTILLVTLCAAAAAAVPLAGALEPLTSAIIAQKVVQASVAAFVRPPAVVLVEGGRRLLMPTEMRIGRVLLRSMTTRQHRLLASAATAETATAVTVAAPPRGASTNPSQRWQRAVRSFGRVKVVVRKYAHWCMYFCNVCVATTACAGGLESSDDAAAASMPLALMVLRDVVQDTLQNI